MFYKAGIIEEMLEDTMESLDDNEDMEEEAQEEIDKVLFDLVGGIFFHLQHKITCNSI